MPSVLPSQIVAAINAMFGEGRPEINSNAVRHHYQNEVRALLQLMEDVPSTLIVLPFADYLELTRCRAVLATAVAKWSVDDITAAHAVGGKDPVERIRRLMAKCADELPPPEPILEFIKDDEIRIGIEEQIRAAWTDFQASEWIGATVLAGAALEAILYWAMKNRMDKANEATLAQLIERGRSANIISQETKQQAGLAKDARNLIHPGKSDQLSTKCSRATALTALAAVYRVSDDLRQRLGGA